MTSHDIYNTYLAISRGARNKPWRARKDFSDFDDTKDGLICKRLEMFFKKFPQINPHEYFRSPYIIYKDEDLFPLSFYTTQKAIAVYTAVQKQKKEELPDTFDQIADIKKSLKYIAETCVKERLTLAQYCQKSEGYAGKPIVDYNNKRLNIYVLVQLPFFEKQLNSLSPQDRVLYLQDVATSITKYKMRLNMSTRAKNIIDNGLQLINKLNQNKTTS